MVGGSGLAFALWLGGGSRGAVFGKNWITCEVRGEGSRAVNGDGTERADRRAEAATCTEVGVRGRVAGESEGG